MNLISTVYISSATKLFRPNEPLELLRAAQENNAQAGLSGMLLYHDGNFMQVLEGPELAVDTLIEKLKLDPRHCGLMVPRRKLIDAPLFAKWHMAFRDTKELSPAELAEVNPFLQPTFSGAGQSERSSAALKLLENFARIYVDSPSLSFGIDQQVSSTTVDLLQV